MSLPSGSAGQGGGVDIAGTVGGVGGDIVGRDKITYGLTAEELVAVLEKKGVLRTAGEAGLELQTILKLARRLKPDEALDLDQAVTELSRAVDVALDVIARGERGTNQDDFVNAVLARVAKKTRIGDLDGGASTIDHGLAELDVAYRRSRGALLEEGVKVDILRRDAIAVTRRIEALVALDQPTDRPAWLPAFRERYDAFCEDGEAKGINFSLSVAIELARRMVATAHDSAERGTAVNLLGTALGRLGDREAGTTRLDEAVTVFRDELKEKTRERVSLQWAMTQNNLGLTLSKLGAREVGTARLEEAVTALREALREWTRERVPLDWATAQNNLGVALSAFGTREAGTARLVEAVTAFRDALKEWTRERVPLDWATAQNNLGVALSAFGTREAGTARLEEAVTAFREALKERTRERVPLQWATTQSNLGSVLRALGTREAGTARLDEAVTAFREALKEETRERVPLRWAITQNNLGNALFMLDAREAGTARLEEAVTAFREALKEVTRQRVPLQWALGQNNLGSVLWRLGEREAGTARLEEAVTAFRDALKESTRERMPLQWATIFGNQGGVLLHLAQRRNDAAMAETALTHITTASKAMRTDGYAADALYYEAQLPEARAVVKRLRGRRRFSLWNWMLHG